MSKEETIEFFIEQLGDNKILGKEKYSLDNLLKNKKNINQIDNKEPKVEIIEYKESSCCNNQRLNSN